MPDGSLIQERDPLTVPSTRRNPVLADVLNRLGYMEGKGSGLEKIISGYEFQINYDDTKKPIFRSDRYQFTVVMPNLNYDVPQDVTTNVTKDNLDDQILSLIRKDSRISTRKMAERLGRQCQNDKSAFEKNGLRKLYWSGIQWVLGNFRGGIIVFILYI